MTSVQNQGNQQIQGAIPQIKPAHQPVSPQPQIQPAAPMYSTVPTSLSAPVAPPIAQAQTTQ